MKFFLTIVLVFLLENIGAQSVCPIIPTPQSYKSQTEGLVLKTEITVNWGNVPDVIREYFTDKMSALYGVKILSVVQEAQITFIHNNQLLVDHYRMDTRGKVMVEYGDERGAFYAVCSLLQMIQGKENSIYVAGALIEDGPGFEWRGLHLDVSRHFFTVEEVKRFIDLMSLYKFSVFHWHLTDDQGWRIEIKKYPKLTEIGAFRDSTIIGHYSDTPRKYKHERYGGFYTQEEISEIIRYAGDRYITVVPEIELPGHSRAALSAYPQYSCTGEQQEVPGLWGIFDDIYCSKEESILFLQDVLSEVLELFPSRYIHIGGDEAPKTRWKECTNCQQNIKRLGLHDEHELQSYVIGRMDQFLTKHGRQLIGWDEILEGGLSENAAVMSWRGEKGGIESAKQGHMVVMSPTTYCYFDYYQSAHRQEPLAIGGYLPLEKVYAFNPVPMALSSEEAKFILGGQANLWTEYIPDMNQLEYMTYPRALALSQSLWSKKKPSYDQFLETVVKYQENFLRRNNVNYAGSLHFPELQVSVIPGGIELSLKNADPDEVFSVQIAGDTSYIRSFTELFMSKNDTYKIYRDDVRSGGVYQINVKGEHDQGEFNYLLHRSRDLGRKIEVSPTPHPKYNHNGYLNLVDGIHGGLPWKGSDWLGFQDPLIELKFDLEESHQLKGVKIGLLNSPGSWIYLPERIAIYTSSDGLNWDKLNSFDIVVKDESNSRHMFEFETETRFVKLQMKAMEEIPMGMDGAGSTPWTFIDEVELIYSEP